MKDLLAIAISQYGVEEKKGSNHNPIILNYFKEIGSTWVTDDETAWCSCFMNWCCLKSGYEKTGKLNARSWLKLGKEVEKPETGDLVVFWREHPDSWQGHVAIFIREIGDYIYVLGGNQSDKVCIRPYKKNQVLSYRKLKKIHQEQ